MRETADAVLSPRRFALSLREGHHGLSAVIAVSGSAAALAAAVDLMVAAAADAPVALGTVIVDMALFAVAVSVAAAVAALASALAARVRGSAGRMDLNFAAITFALAPLLLAPIAAGVAVLFGLWTICLVAIGALLLRSLISLGLNLTAVSGGRALAGVGIAIAILTIALFDRMGAAVVTGLTMEPAVLAALPSAPSGGLVQHSGAFAVTLPPDWSRANTGIDIARFEHQTEDLRIVRLRRAQLDTLITAADRALERELRPIQVLESSRSFWRVGSDLVIEDVRAGTHGGREIAFVLYSRRTSEGAIGLLFHIVGPHDRAAALERYRALAQTLSVGP